MNKKLLTLIIGSIFAGCANGKFNSIGSSILSSTGVVTSSQADSIFSAGGNLIKSQEELTPEQEFYLGRAVSAKILGQYPPSSNQALQKYVNRVGGVIAGVSDTPETFGGYHFAVVQSNDFNAMAAPGGFIFVTSRFVQALPNEDALAAVLAHEVAHIVHRDGVDAISNASLFAALSTVAQESASYAVSRVGSPVDLTAITNMFSESVGTVSEKLLTQGYSRDQEYEADAYALKLMEKAGYNPKEMATVLEMLKSAEGKENSGWFSTHPDPEDRLEEVNDEVEDLAPIDTAPVRVARFKANLGN